MKAIGKLVIAVALVFLIYPGTFISYWFLRGVFMPDPTYGIRLERDMEKLSSDVLIKNLHSIDPLSPRPTYAMMILGDRKERRAVPYLLKEVHTWNKYSRTNAIMALGKIGDERAIDPLMAIVKKGKKEKNYENALMALSKLKYQGVYPYVVDLAKSGDPFANGSVIMLGELGNPAALPLLEEIKSKIDKSRELSGLDSEQVDAAIKKIKG